MNGLDYLAFQNPGPLIAVFFGMGIKNYVKPEPLSPPFWSGRHRP